MPRSTSVYQKLGCVWSVSPSLIVIQRSVLASEISRSLVLVMRAVGAATAIQRVAKGSPEPCQTSAFGSLNRENTAYAPGLGECQRAWVWLFRLFHGVWESREESRAARKALSTLTRERDTQTCLPGRQMWGAFISERKIKKRKRLARIDRRMSDMLSFRLDLGRWCFFGVKKFNEEVWSCCRKHTCRSGVDDGIKETWSLTPPSWFHFRKGV